MFGFDNRTEIRAAYTHGLQDLSGRLVFVDSDPGDPFAALTIQNDPVVNAVQIEAALGIGAHFVLTDFPAPVDGLVYYVEIPDGTPARCNPRTAPAECTALAIEDPAFVGSGGSGAR